MKNQIQVKKRGNRNGQQTQAEKGNRAGQGSGLKSSIGIVFQHAMATLPAAIPERKRVLQAVLNALKAEHPLHARAGELLSVTLREERAGTAGQAPPIRADLAKQMWIAGDALESAVDRAEGLLMILARKLGEACAYYDFPPDDKCMANSLTYIALDVAELLRVEMDQTWNVIKQFGPAAARAQTGEDLPR